MIRNRLTVRDPLADPRPSSLIVRRSKHRPSDIKQKQRRFVNSFCLSHYSAGKLLKGGIAGATAVPDFRHPSQ